MKRNRLWLPIVGASMIGFLIVLSGCDSVGADPGIEASPSEATLVILHNDSVLDGETAVDYGFVSEGDSDSETFTIRNDGSATANLTGAKVTIAGTYADEFVADTSSTADAIAPGESTTVEVFFTPTSTGALSDETVTLSIESDAATAPPAVDLSFSVIMPIPII